MTTHAAIAALRHGPRGTSLDMLPYAALLGVHFDRDGDGVRLVMPYREALTGAPGRLHGGAVAGLLELAATATLLLALPADHPLPRLKPVTVTVDFMREGVERDSFASATLTRLGRRIANLSATAWQYDHSRPIAAANLNILLDRG